MQRVAINGFGRIGRNVLRAWFENPKNFQFEIVAVNDVADVETLLHLFKYDTTHGRFPGKVDLSYENEKKDETNTMTATSTTTKSLTQEVSAEEVVTNDVTLNIEIPH